MKPERQNLVVEELLKETANGDATTESELNALPRALARNTGKS